jgi:hypothetical protein
MGWVVGWDHTYYMDDAGLGKRQGIGVSGC